MHKDNFFTGFFSDVYNAYLSSGYVPQMVERQVLLTLQAPSLLEIRVQQDGYHCTSQPQLQTFYGSAVQGGHNEPKKARKAAETKAAIPTPRRNYGGTGIFPMGRAYAFSRKSHGP